MAIASRQVAFKEIDIIVEDEKTERGFQERKARRNRTKVRIVGCFSAAVFAFPPSPWSINRITGQENGISRGQR